MTGRSITIEIDEDRKCVECGKGGAMPSGICLGCADKALAGKLMKSSAGKRIQIQLARKDSEKDG